MLSFKNYASHYLYLLTVIAFAFFILYPFVLAQAIGMVYPCHNIISTEQKEWSKSRLTSPFSFHLVVCLSSQVEKQKADLNKELEDLQDRLEEQGGATAAQVSSHEHTTVQTACLHTAML